MNRIVVGHTQDTRVGVQVLVQRKLENRGSTVAGDIDQYIRRNSEI